MSDTQTTPDPIPGWEPQQEICLVLDDKVGTARSGVDLEGLLQDIRDAAGRHGFDISMHGTKPGFARFFHRHFNMEGTYRE